MVRTLLVVKYINYGRSKKHSVKHVQMHGFSEIVMLKMLDSQCILITYAVQINFR